MLPTFFKRFYYILQKKIFFYTFVHFYPEIFFIYSLYLYPSILFKWFIYFPVCMAVCTAQLVTQLWLFEISKQVARKLCMMCGSITHPWTNGSRLSSSTQAAGDTRWQSLLERCMFWVALMEPRDWTVLKPMILFTTAGQRWVLAEIMTVNIWIEQFSNYRHFADPAVKHEREKMVFNLN